MSTNTHHDWQPASQCHAGEASTGSKPNSKSVPNGTTTPAYYSESQPIEGEMPLQVVTGERNSGQLEPLAGNRDLKDLAAVKRKLQGPEASTEINLSHHQSGEIIMRSQQELQKILDLLAGHRPAVNLSNLKLFVKHISYQRHCPRTGTTYPRFPARSRPEEARMDSFVSIGPSKSSSTRYGDVFVGKLQLVTIPASKLTPPHKTPAVTHRDLSVTLGLC